MLFATYRFLMKLQVHDNDTQDQQRQPTLAQIFLAGAGCGLASTLLTTPIELIKIQQQKHQQLLHTTHEVGGRRNTSPTSASASASARAVALHIYRTGGIRALYRGLSATIWRDVGGYGLYFYGYEGTLRLFVAHPDSNVDDTDTDTDTISHSRPRPWWAAPLVAGAAAGIIGWIATFPFDVLKTRLQAGSIPGMGIMGAADMTDTDKDAASGRLGSSWRTAHKMYAESGGRVFWRGLVPTLVRAVPVNMALFGTFESVLWAFSRT